MQKVSKILNLVYELLDEIIGGVLPGIYFCTYFLLCALIIVKSNGIFSLSDGGSFIVSLLFLSVSYVLGTLFKRGNMEYTDTKSVMYILKRSKRTIKGSEYMLDLPDNYCNEVLFKKIEMFKEDYLLFISKSYIKNERRIWQYNKQPQHKLCFYVYKKLKAEYRRTIFLCLIFNVLQKYSKKDFKVFKKKKDLESLCVMLEKDINLQVDYPYTHLKKYLKYHNLNEIANNIDWGTQYKHKGKAFVNEMMFDINKYNLLEAKEIKRKDAHITFMNSCFHSQRTLFFANVFITISILIIYIVKAVLIWIDVFGEGKAYLTKVPRFISFWGDKVFKYIARIVDFETLFIILCISVVYIGFNILTKKFILGNFHYQRIREIVYILQARENALDN